MFKWLQIFNGVWNFYHSTHPILSRRTPSHSHDSGVGFVGAIMDPNWTRNQAVLKTMDQLIGNLTTSWIQLRIGLKVKGTFMFCMYNVTLWGPYGPTFYQYSSHHTFISSRSCTVLIFTHIRTLCSPLNWLIKVSNVERPLNLKGRYIRG